MKTSKKTKNQQTLETTLTNSKREMIQDLIQAFADADIPLEKINSLIPFFKKYVKEGGAIPQAPTLR